MVREGSSGVIRIQIVIASLSVSISLCVSSDIPAYIFSREVCVCVCVGVPGPISWINHLTVAGVVHTSHGGRGERWLAVMGWAGWSCVYGHY